MGEYSLIKCVHAMLDAVPVYLFTCLPLDEESLNQLVHSESPLLQSSRVNGRHVPGKRQNSDDQARGKRGKNVEDICMEIICNRAMAMITGIQ